MGLYRVSQGQVNEQRNILTSRLGSNREESERVDKPEQEVSCSKPAHPNHGLTKGVLHHTITHADDEE